MRESFTLKQELDVFEEFDGMNHEGAKHMVMVVQLPLMVRGNSVHIRAFDDILSLRVPNLYKLQLSLPVAIEHEDCLSFFDCKLRRMIIVAPVQEPKIQEVVEVFEDSAAPTAESETGRRAPTEESKQSSANVTEEVQPET